MTKKSLLPSFFNKNTRTLKKYEKNAHLVENLIAKMGVLTDNQLKQEFSKIKKEVLNLKKLNPDKITVLNKEHANQLIALGAIACERVLGLKPFFVQIMGSLVLLDGSIAEMKTGEGKTLTASLSALARSVEERGVHVITVNGYLAKRDAQSMGKIYEFFNQSVAVISEELTTKERIKAYQSDIIYTTNAEIGFDYLRNNLALSKDEKVTRDLFFAIVDEVDSILIDEARTPLIISSISDEAQELAIEIDKVARKLTPSNEEYGDGDFWPNEKHKSIVMSENGLLNAEKLFVESGLLNEDESLYAPHNITFIYYLEAALKAHHLYQKNVDYIVKDDAVFIIDTFTGRVLDGRRWSYGLHQAAEIKEGVSIKPETQTSASITLQNLFRNYNILSGMTGTAKTEEAEFIEIYNLNVVSIPTHKPLIRKDYPDMVFLTKEGKEKRLIEDVKKTHITGQPILIGTSSIDSSEKFSDLLNKNNLKHNVLNAKHHEKEASIIAQAGSKYAITIATNMAGRGTDIILGGSNDHLSVMMEEIKSMEYDLSFMKPQSKSFYDLGKKINDLKKVYNDEKDKWQRNHDEVISLGGLHVIGTERHESRRIDNQLRGRSARQGDPGSSVFYVSFDDSLIRIFSSGWATQRLRSMGMTDDDVISMPMVSKQIQKAQKAVEAHNFNIRKALLTYDDISNEQRLSFYKWRSEILEKENIDQDIYDYLSDSISYLLSQAYESFDDEKDKDVLDKINNILSEYNLSHIDVSGVDLSSMQNATEQILDRVFTWMDNRQSDMPDKNWNEIKKTIFLTAADKSWREHLVLLEHLRQGIHLRSFAQKKPHQEYKREAYILFESMVQKIRDDLLVGWVNVLLDNASFFDNKETSSQSLNKNKNNNNFKINNFYWSVPWSVPQNTIDKLHFPPLIFPSLILNKSVCFYSSDLSITKISDKNNILPVTPTTTHININYMPWRSDV